MQAFSRTLLSSLLTGVLLAAVMAPLAATGVWLDSASHGPGECHLSKTHEHAGQVPEPESGGHACCQLGHHPAIAQPTPTSRRSLEGILRVECSELAPVARPFSRFQHGMISGGDPPITSPLRL